MLPRNSAGPSTGMSFSSGISQLPKRGALLYFSASVCISRS